MKFAQTLALGALACCFSAGLSAQMMMEPLDGGGGAPAEEALELTVEEEALLKIQVEEKGVEKIIAGIPSQMMTMDADSKQVIVVVWQEWSEKRDQAFHKLNWNNIDVELLEEEGLLERKFVFAIDSYFKRLEKQQEDGLIFAEDAETKESVDAKEPTKTSYRTTRTDKEREELIERSLVYLDRAQ